MMIYFDLESFIDIKLGIIDHRADKLSYDKHLRSRSVNFISCEYFSSVGVKFFQIRYFYN